jgi:hypothetical protein
MTNFLRLDKPPFVLECYTENEYGTPDECFPEFKVSYDNDASPRYTIHVRGEEDQYSELAKYDTLKEAELHISDFINSRRSSD